MAKNKQDLLVADLMSRELVTCPGHANLGTVATMLARKRIHSVIVVDDDGNPSGVLTDFDLLAGEWLGDDSEHLRTMRGVTAAELMSSPIESIHARASAAAAAEQMQQRHLSRLLVTDEQGATVGVIAVSDLVAPLGRPSGRRRCVGDVMSRAIVTCSPESSLEAASRAMTDRRSRSIVVVGEGGHAAGVITGNDLLSLYRSGEQRGTVAEMMNPPITCSPDLTLSEAADKMIRNEVHRLVVVDPARPDGAPVGIVSTSDIVAEMAYERSVWQEAPD
jgi:CBS domain-containing protein